MTTGEHLSTQASKWLSKITKKKKLTAFNFFGMRVGVHLVKANDDFLVVYIVGLYMQYKGNGDHVAITVTIIRVDNENTTNKSLLFTILPFLQVSPCLKNLFRTEQLSTSHSLLLQSLL